MLSDRQAEIVALIAREGTQYIDDLARRYGLTTQTIRRDINALCDLGYARRFHGGVGAPVESRNTSTNERYKLNTGAKRAIARRVAADIPDGATVLMGIGTSVQFVAEALRERENLFVVTNNLDVVQALGHAHQIDLQLVGGHYLHNDRITVGPEALRAFAKFRATCCVVGAGGLHPEVGVLEFTQDEAEITHALLESAEQRFLVADHSKWHRPATIKATPFARLSRFYTDLWPPSGMDASATLPVETVICG